MENEMFVCGKGEECIRGYGRELLGVEWEAESAR